MLQYLLLLFSFIFSVCCTLHKRDYTRMNYYTMRIDNSEGFDSIQQVVSHLNANFEGKVGELDNYYWISIPKEHDEGEIYHKYERLKKRNFPPVYDIQLQTPSRRLFKRAPPINIQQELFVNQQNLKKSLAIGDPGFEQQWHLINTQERGHDLNVSGVWSQGITGKGSVVAILDDGLDFEHEDLRDNYYAEGSFDFNNRGPHPKPRLDDDTHGTRCAGEIASSKNNVCGIGVAYDAKVSGIRILSGDVTEGDEAAAINYKYQENQIYSCSWGPSDYGEVAEGPQGIVLEAIKNGIQKGRNGKGSIFVFASGNGGYYDDNCNFDGYTNSIYTITVGAIDRLGNHPNYGEKCAAQFFATYSSGNGHHIYTTDVGSGRCTETHGGTSAAAPLAAGVFALVLSVRPDLTWRDLQHLCVMSAIPISLEDEDWKKLPSGRMFNHKYGYGVLDAYRMVELSKTFQSVGPQTSLELTNIDPLEIPDITSNQTTSSLRSVIMVSDEMVISKRLFRLEHVTVTVNIKHTRRGDLEILLISPNNVISQLGTPRKNDYSREGFINWTFMSVKHWEESAVGSWTLQIIDTRNPEHTGSLLDWKLTLWGENSTLESYDQQKDLRNFIVKNSKKLATHNKSLLIYFTAFCLLSLVVGTFFFVRKHSKKRSKKQYKPVNDTTFELCDLLQDSNSNDQVVK